MNNITKEVIIDTMRSNQSADEKADTIASQIAWLDGFEKTVIKDALVLVMRELENSAVNEEIEATN